MSTEEIVENQEDNYSDYLEEETEDLIVEEEAVDEPEEKEEDDFNDDGQGDEVEEAPIDELDIDGEKVKTDDLKEAYKRTVEYQKLTDEVTEYKSKVVERANNVENVFNNLNSYIQSLIPKEPPLSLLHTNPSEYLIARETREAIIKEFKEILSYKNEFSSEIQELDSSDFNVLKSKEELKLKNKIPELKSEENLQTFRANFKKIGAEIGFTDKEIDNCVDSRMLEMAYYASIGKRASEKRNNAVHAQKRIASKPIKSVPNKFTNLSSQSKNNSAFAKLTKSGSIADALKIDF